MKQKAPLSSACLYCIEERSRGLSSSPGRRDLQPTLSCLAEAGQNLGQNAKGTTDAGGHSLCAGPFLGHMEEIKKPGLVLYTIG